MADKFYITTPIYYVNDRPHLGHVYTTTVADVIARYHRLLGEDVYFTTGVDEHAAKVADAAKERGLTPQQMADQFAAVFEETFKRLGITNSVFVRTSQERHKTKVREYVEALLKSGDVYAGQYEGWYDAGQEEYVTDSKAAESGFKSPINGKPLVRKKEKNYFFRLEKYRDAVAAAIRDKVFDVEPEARRNEILNRLTEARDVPISRTGSGGWGIPVPGDDEQTIYVWIDALFNYLTYVDTPELRGYWTSGGGATHLIAKDILWFHAAIWPAMLMALAKCPGYDWVRLPKTVYSHSFWISEGQKMSKSLGNFVDLEKLDHYVSTFSLDALRYFLASNGPLGTTDSDFAEAKFIEVYNTDLANTLGNCFSRISNMTNRYFGGKLPESLTRDGSTLFQFGNMSNYDFVWGQVHFYMGAMEKLDLVLASHYAIGVVRAVDEYIALHEPFKMIKDPANTQKVGTILYNCTEAMRYASLMLWPIIPNKIEVLWERLGLDVYSKALSNCGSGDFKHWTEGWGPKGQLQPGAQIAQGDPLFPRYQAAK